MQQDSSTQSKSKQELERESERLADQTNAKNEEVEEIEEVEKVDESMSWSEARSQGEMYLSQADIESIESFDEQAPA